MFDLSTEQAFPLTEATRFVPASRGGKRTHLGTLIRWIEKGCKAPDGRVVRLEALRLGGKWVTSLEAIQRFAESLTPTFESDPVAAPRSSSARQRASEKAARELEKMGI